MARYENATEYFEAYSVASDQFGPNALFNALGEKFGYENTEDGRVPKALNNLWVFDIHGVLTPLPDEQKNLMSVLTGLISGVVFAVPGIGEDGQPDFSQVNTLTGTRVIDKDGIGTYYIQILDPATAKEAYENRPVGDEPGVWDKIVDFFCRVFGSRGTVCALWDAAQMTKDAADNMNFASGAGEAGEKYMEAHLEEDMKQIAENDTKIEDKSARLLDNLNPDDYTRQQKEYTDEEKQRAKQITENRVGQFGMSNYNEELTGWYMALYAKSHDMFPAVIAEDVEVDMAKMDQQAMKFANGKLNFRKAMTLLDGNSADVIESEEAAPYTVTEELSNLDKSFDIRPTIVTNLAFALTADDNISAEDVFKFLAGEEVPGLEGLGEKMDAEMAKFHDEAARKSPEMQALMQKGVTRMCKLLENREKLDDAISYQLGTTLNRNRVMFNEQPGRGLEGKMKFTMLANQIMKVQDQIQESYNANVLNGFAMHGFGEDDMGHTFTEMQAAFFLPMNVAGQTNAAFLKEIAKANPAERMKFIKENKHVLDNMNENLKAFIHERLEIAKEDSEDCKWLNDPQNLQKAINGGIIKEYKEVVLESVRTTGKMPTFQKKHSTIEIANEFPKLTQDEIDAEFERLTEEYTNPLDKDYESYTDEDWAKMEARHRKQDAADKQFTGKYEPGLSKAKPKDLGGMAKG